jgi:hypothetical protein
LRLQSLPRCRAAPGERAWGAAGLGWCSPQSSVPRQTVGHHARAAMYEMGLTAACEGCRGEVPRLCLDIPPTGACFVPFSYTHRPGRSGSHGPAGSWVDLPIPQKSFVWVLLKIGSRARKSAFAHHEPTREAGARQNDALVLGTTQHTNAVVVPRPAAALPAPFSYTHRPGRSGRHGPAGSWVDFPIPQKSFVWVLLKIGSRAPTRGSGTGGPPGPGPAPACPRQPCGVALGGGRAPPRCLPYTPTGLPYTAPPTLHPARTQAPASQAAYPAPGRPTLHPASYSQPSLGGMGQTKATALGFASTLAFDPSTVKTSICENQGMKYLLSCYYIENTPLDYSMLSLIIPSVLTKRTLPHPVKIYDISMVYRPPQIYQALQDLKEKEKTKNYEKPLRKKSSPLNTLSATLPLTPPPTLYQGQDPPKPARALLDVTPGKAQRVPRPGRPKGEKLAPRHTYPTPRIAYPTPRLPPSQPTSQPTSPGNYRPSQPTLHLVLPPEHPIPRPPTLYPAHATAASQPPHPTPRHTTHTQVAYPIPARPTHTTQPQVAGLPCTPRPAYPTPPTPPPTTHTQVTYPIPPPTTRPPRWPTLRRCRTLPRRLPCTQTPAPNRPTLHRLPPHNLPPNRPTLHRPPPRNRLPPGPPTLYHAARHTTPGGLPYLHHPRTQTPAPRPPTLHQTRGGTSGLPPHRQHSAPPKQPTLYRSPQARDKASARLPASLPYTHMVADTVVRPT